MSGHLSDIGRPQHLRLLIVEDNGADADLVRERLSSVPGYRFELTHETSLASALATLQREPRDAVILDLHLEDSAGIETLRSLVRVQPNVGVVILSGYLDGNTRELALREGAHELISKNEGFAHSLWRGILLAIERRRAQYQRQQVEKLISAHPDAVLVVDLAGVVRFLNEATLSIFGRNREELIDERLAFSVREGDVVDVQILRSGELRTGEMRVVRFDWDGNPAFMVLIRDITDRKRAEELQTRARELEELNREISEANRMKTEFLANMSHELRTPLNAIIGFAQLLHDGRVDLSSGQAKEFIGDILTSGRHLLRLINDILDLAKVEAGRLSFKPVPFNLRRGVSEVATILRTQAALKSIVIAIEHDPSVNEIEIDPGRFKQVLYNYLSNALKFTPDGGQIVIRVRAEPSGWFRLEVNDSGVGISAEDQALLFREFNQLERGARRDQQGTGLGLALTKRLVEAQGGTVGVESEIGRGSSFWARLPCHYSPSSN